MSVTLGRLARRAKTIDKTHQRYKLLMKYDGETVAEYDMSDKHLVMDAMCFLIHFSE